MEQTRIHNALRWAVNWIEHCNEVPVPGDEQEDWEDYEAARELALRESFLPSKRVDEIQAGAQSLARDLRQLKREARALREAVVRADRAQPGEVVQEWQDAVDLADPDGLLRAALHPTPPVREEEARACTCDWTAGTQIMEGTINTPAPSRIDDPNCPVHGSVPDTCPSCGSDDPGWHREPHYGCTDPWHSGPARGGS